MADPVVTVDGQVFESSLIEEWFRIPWLSSSRNHPLQKLPSDLRDLHKRMVRLLFHVDERNHHTNLGVCKDCPFSLKTM